jgi:hypothetical protein
MLVDIFHSFDVNGNVLYRQLFQHKCNIKIKETTTKTTTTTAAAKTKKNLYVIA